MSEVTTKPPLFRPRVLFIAPTSEDYLADGIFHGLRSVLGDRVVDHPRIDAMYAPLDEGLRARLYGRGFSLYGLLEDLPVDRHRIDTQLADGMFDAVVFSNIHLTFGRFVEILPFLHNTKVAILDGADAPSLYPYSGTYWREPHRWFLPRAHTRFHYFKREWTSETLRSRYFRLCPPALERHLPVPMNLHRISFSIPEEKIVREPESAPKLKDWPSHIVDAEVKARLEGSSEAYAFDREGDYYLDLQRSRFGITTKRAGWDCLRHYEIAANGSVPCFRSLEEKPTTCAPHGLSEENCISYRSAEELFRRIEAMADAEYDRLRAGAIAWARSSSTKLRARQLLATIGLNNV